MSTYQSGGGRHDGDRRDQFQGGQGGRGGGRRRRGRRGRGGRGGGHPGGQGGGQQGGHQGGHQGGQGGGHHQGGGSRQSTGGGGRQILDIDGMPLVMPPGARPFEELTSIDPQPRLTLEYPGCPASCRLVDMFCPIGRGQRSLIVSPPKAGKTTLLKDIGTALLRNHPDIELVVLLVDERPEEVTDFKRHFAQVAESLAPKELVERGEAAAAELGLPNAGLAGGGPSVPPRSRVRVVASSNDHTTDKHIEVATTTIERCRHMVAAGKHVVVLLDSITRLGRAFNQSRRHASSGRTMSGGLDSKALEVPRALFGAARNTEPSEGGGSLTIIASCLVDTGSQADQVIFEEFKGSGNMELILDRSIAEKRLFPAINLAASGTRKENLLIPEKELQTITALRRQLLMMPPPVQVEKLLAALQKSATNAKLLGG